MECKKHYWTYYMEKCHNTTGYKFNVARYCHICNKFEKKEVIPETVTNPLMLWDIVKEEE